VAEQSRAQQASMSPAIDLVADQLLKPLHIAETLSKSRELIELMDIEEGGETDKTQALNMLTRLEQEFGMIFFIASEQQRLQINSDGTEIALVEGEVSWYFKYRDGDRDAVADIGKWEDTHFYIDLKIYDDDGRFLGFFGVGKALGIFLNVFDSYKRQHGYDFVFVDTQDDIMLSSDPALIAEYSQFKNLADLPWFDALSNDVKASKSLNNRLVRIKGQDYLIAEIELGQFDWTMYLLSPLTARQTEISRGFIVSVVTLLVVIFALFLIIYNMLYYFRRDMQANHLNYHHNRLPDRLNVEEKYNELMEKDRSMSVVIIDIDNFNTINDTYGRNIGDEVIERFSSFLTSQVRDRDIVGRWSSEEFILLLPDTGPHEAYDIAQQLRHGLTQIQPPERYPNLRLTATFGISYTAITRSMNEVSAYADDALYQAKRDGSNVVRMQLIDE
jgi:diguanylate cyclase (GGDEF)-like protein